MTPNLTAYSKSIRPGTAPFFMLVPFLLGALLFWPFSSGGKKVSMLPSHDTPAARGNITIKSGHGNNANLEIKVQSLAHPTTLTPPKHAYVVWIQAPGDQPQNQGEMMVNNKQQGQLNTVTSYPRFKVFITPEDNAQVKTPTGNEVLSADVLQG